MRDPSTRRECVRSIAEERLHAQQLLEQAERLPTLPDIPSRALEVLEHPDAALAEVGDVIALDPVLAARCLRLANSPTFSFGEPIQTIQMAVVRLGARELRALLLTVSLTQAFERTTLVDLREIWRHAIATAVLARRLARDLDEPEPDRAYLAGLLHSLGEVVLATCFADRFERALEGVPPEDVPAALLAEFGVAPTQCCARILEHWNMPASVVEAVEYLPIPSAAPHVARLARIVQNASFACRAFGIGAKPPFGPALEWRAQISRDLITEACDGDPDSYLESLECVIESLGEILAALLA